MQSAIFTLSRHQIDPDRSEAGLRACFRVTKPPSNTFKNTGAHQGYPGSCRSSAIPKRASRTHRLSRRGPPKSVKSTISHFPRKNRLRSSVFLISPLKTHRFCALRAPCSLESDRLVHPRAHTAYTRVARYGYGVHRVTVSSGIRPASERRIGCYSLDTAWTSTILHALYS
jgi:hypothetical protein